MKENKFINTLIKEGKGEQLEVHANVDTDSIFRTVCGFLNTKGGRLIIGIHASGKPEPIDEIDRQLDAIQTLIFEEIKPTAIVGIRKEDFKDSEIILVEVIEGNKKPYSYKNKTYVRVNRRTTAANEAHMSFLIRDRKIFEYSWERSQCLEVQLEDLDFEEIENTIIKANKVKRSVDFDVNNKKQFLDFNQLAFNQGYTNGAIVLFGNKPTHFLPQCMVRIVEFPHGKTGNEFGNTVLIEDNLFKAFREIQYYFKRTIPLVSKFEDSEWERNDEYKYPLQALDEAVINAMMHRDYSDRGGEVFISVYNDKIEITNSGELPHFLTTAKLKKSHQSVPPNPNITHMVFLTGMIEKVGRGTVLINDQFTKLGHPPPIWESKNGFTKLTLFGAPKKIELNNRMHKFLETYKNDSFIREDYAKFFENKISEKTARNDLSKLVEGGYLTKLGKGPKTSYLRK